jgi:hypothetical protein
MTSFANNTPSWSIAIFAARESISTLTACVNAVVRACAGKAAVIDVLVNGNRALAEQAKQLSLMDMPEGDNVAIRVWFLPVADKAHTWNEFVHRIWSSSEIVYFIDGYAEVRPDALAFMEAGLGAAPDALGITGVPTLGRSADRLRRLLLQEGGIHGNLYAIRDEVIASLKECGFRMPRGLYRTDSLIGAVLMFRLNPAKYGWDTTGLIAQPQATWSVRRTDWWSLKDIQAWYRRKLRQAQGILENRAISTHLSVKRGSPQTLPRTVNELVDKWIDAYPRSARSVFLKHPLTLYAVRQLRRRQNSSAGDPKPILLRLITAKASTQSLDLNV